MKFFLWKLYTFVFNLLFLLLDVMPLFIRHLVFCCLFGKISNINLIDYKCYFRYPHKISIGRHVSINRNCVFLASAHSDEKFDIVIGDNCVFAPYVKLLSAAHDYHFLDLPDTFGKIEIGNNVWLGAGCIILPGKK